LCLLVRRSGRSGRQTVDHPSRAHDDVANAAAGALILALTTPGTSVSHEMTREEYRMLQAAFGGFLYHLPFDDNIMGLTRTDITTFCETAEAHFSRLGRSDDEDPRADAGGRHAT
jgi:hypothetical protein